MGLSHRLAHQFRKPTGLLGKLVGLVLRLNRKGNNWTIELLNIQPTDHLLEVGFGTGHATQKIATLASQGWVAGVDFSEAMVQKACKRNAAAIVAGRVKLRCGDAAALPYHDNSFDKILAANVIYFWQDPLVYLNELRRVMKPGGRLALYVVAREDMAKIKFTRTGVFTLYTGEEVVHLLTQAGFSHARFESKAERYRFRTGICALAEK